MKLWKLNNVSYFCILYEFYNAETITYGVLSGLYELITVETYVRVNVSVLMFDKV